MIINEGNREQIRAIFQRLERHLTEEEKNIVSIFDEPVARNVYYDHETDRFSDRGNHLEPKHLRYLVRKKMLFFDFSDERDEDKADYERNGYEWRDEYSYHRVGFIESDYQSDFGLNEDESFIILEDEEGDANYCRFDIRECEYIDETHIAMTDRYLHNGEKRIFCIRPTETDQQY